MTKPKLVMRKGAQSSEWGTPPEVLDVVRNTFGSIDLDLASSAKWNKIVGARRFYSAENPCPVAPEVHRNAVVFCNPPAGVKQTRWFWDVWWRLANPGGFLIYQIDHWRSLPGPGSLFDSLYCCLWPKRLKFLGAPSSANFSSVLVLTRPPLGFAGNVVVWR